MGRSLVRVHRWRAVGASVEHAAHRGQGRRACGALAALAIALIASCGARDSLLGNDGEGAGGAAGGASADGAGAAYGAGGAGGAPVECIPSEEVCNGLDDDCDGAVDEGWAFARKSGPHQMFGTFYSVQGDLVATDLGFLLSLNRDFFAPSDEDNVFNIVLDPDGSESTEPGSLPSLTISTGPRLTPGPGGFFASFCKWAAPGDRAGAAFIDQTADFQNFGTVPPGTNSCYGHTPSAVWTGERLLYTYIDGDTGQNMLVRGDMNGEWIETEALGLADPNRPPRLAHDSGVTVLFLASPELADDVVQLHQVEPDGDLGDFASFPLPTSFGEVIDLVAAPSGPFLLFILKPGEGVYRTAGSEVPVAIPELAGADTVRIVSDPWGGFVVAGTKGGEVPRGYAARLSEQGDVIAYFETAQDPVLGGRTFESAMVAARGESVVVAYVHEAYVETVELGCVAE